MFSKDPNKFDLINNLNSVKLLEISKQFDMMPSEEVDLEDFVRIMKEVLHDTSLIDRDEFLSDLVDLFYRANKSN